MKLSEALFEIHFQTIRKRSTYNGKSLREDCAVHPAAVPYEAWFLKTILKSVTSSGIVLIPLKAPPLNGSFLVVEEATVDAVSKSIRKKLKNTNIFNIHSFHVESKYQDLDLFSRRTDVVIEAL